MFQLVVIVRCKAKTTTLLGGLCIAVRFENSDVFYLAKRVSQRILKP